MRDFLEGLGKTATLPTDAQRVRAIAEAMGVPSPFVEGLFVSARRRGLVQPEPKGRGRYTWSVSRRGEAFIANVTPVTEDQPTALLSD